MEVKKGDRVRRTGKSLLGRGSKPEIKQGDVLEVTFVSNDGYDTYLRFFGESSGYYAEGFELVQSEPTDQELADEYRAGIARQQEIRAILKDKGFILMLEGSTLPAAPDTANPPSKYYFKKVVEEKL